MAVGNYIIDTSVDPATGRTTVSVTAYGPQGQAYQNKWLSGQPAVSPVPGAIVTTPGGNLSALDVVNEAAVGAAQLLANMATNAQPAGVVVEPNPDPSEM